MAFLSTVIIGLLLFFGNLSNQFKSMGLITHIASAHSVSAQGHHHHSGHKHHHHSSKTQKKSKTSHDHRSELSSLIVQMVVIPSQNTFSFFLANAQSPAVAYPKYVLSESSFSTSIFRPPIS